MGLGREEAAKRLAAGDVAFILAADVSRLSELSRIGPSAPFFAGLLVDRAGDGKRAEALFSISLKAESKAVRRVAAAALIPRLLAADGGADGGREQERSRRALAISRTLFQEAPDDAVLRTVFGEALSASKKYQELLDLYAADVSLPMSDRDRSLELIAAVHTNPAEGGTLVTVYFLDGAIGSEHRRTFRELKAIDKGILSARAEAAALGRLSVFDRSYFDALYYFRRVLAGGPESFLLRGELLGDLGKAFQYGGGAKEGAALFLGWERELREGGDSFRDLSLGVGEMKALRFRLLFYAARMRRQLDDAAGADRLFSAALPLAPDDAQRDACMWYLLDNAASLSPASAVPLLHRYAPSWAAPAAFTDFMDRLCGRLVAEKDWPSLLEAFRAIRTVADSATIARYAYVIGRAVSLGYIGASRPLELLDRSTTVPAKPVLDPAETARRFYRIAFESDSASFYYRCLAASYLGENVDPIPAEDQMNEFDRFSSYRSRSGAGSSSGRLSLGGWTFAIGDAAEESGVDEELGFLLDFFSHGCSDFALPYAQAAAAQLEPPEISALAEAFAAAGRWGDSLRFISQLQKRPGYRLNRRDMQLLYPQPFVEVISGAAKRWNVSEPLFYGLVRTESAFIPNVVSHAGAVGLAQLMPKTAADIASRIGIGSDPDLRDPVTNTDLGAWYLADMTRRTGSPLMALLAYNGGPTRVRRWRAQERKLPEDLFLETIPVAETRDYGRKVLAAAAVYGYLYYGMTLERVVADIFPK